MYESRRRGCCLAKPDRSPGRSRDRHAGAVHLDVERGNRLSALWRESAQGRLEAVRLGPRRQVAANRLGLPFDGLDTHRNARQLCEQLTPARERRFAADHG